MLHINYLLTQRIENAQNGLRRVINKKVSAHGYTARARSPAKQCSQRIDYGLKRYSSPSKLNVTT